MDIKEGVKKIEITERTLDVPKLVGSAIGAFLVIGVLIGGLVFWLSSDGVIDPSDKSIVFSLSLGATAFIMVISNEYMYEDTSKVVKIRVIK